MPRILKNPKATAQRQQYEAVLQTRIPLLIANLQAAVRQPKPAGPRPRHRPDQYPDAVIEALALLRVFFKKSLRDTLVLAKTFLPEADWKRLPSYPQLSRRLQRLGQPAARWHEIATPALWTDPDAMTRAVESGQMAWVGLDASGFSMVGPDTWRSDKPGSQRGEVRRSYAKLHLATNLATGEVLAAVLSHPSVGDSTGAKTLLDALTPLAGQIRAVAADGAYDGAPVYTRLNALGVKRSLVRPCDDARHNPDPDYVLRNAVIALCTKDAVLVPGSPPWRLATGAGVRSLIETTFHQLKAMAGSRLMSRSWAGRATEIWTRLRLLNQYQQHAVSPLLERAASVQAMYTDTPIPLPTGTNTTTEKPFIPESPSEEPTFGIYQSHFSRVNARKAERRAHGM